MTTHTVLPIGNRIQPQRKTTWEWENSTGKTGGMLL
jgi:hypothetical protein